jgi:hypothetical protein
MTPTFHIFYSSLLIILALDGIKSELLLALSHCNLNKTIYLFIWRELRSTVGGQFIVGGFCDGERKRDRCFI